MRKIRFRAWDISEKCWIDIKNMGFEGSRTSNELWYVQACDENERDIDPPYFPEMGDVDLMQFTGLFDKGGREIYEGDITDCFAFGLTTVEFKNGVFGLFSKYQGFFPFSDIHGRVKVIGNIHEHPHLLDRSVEE